MDDAVKRPYNMDEVKTVFLRSVEQVLNNLSNDNYNTVITGLVSSIGSWDVSVVLTPDYLPKVAGEVFKDQVLRSFYLNLKYVFFANMASGYGTTFVETLIFDLAIAVSSDMGLVPKGDEPAQAELAQYDSVPAEIKDTLMTAELAATVMTANPWIVVIMLFLAFVDLESSPFDAVGGK